MFLHRRLLLLMVVKEKDHKVDHNITFTTINQLLSYRDVSLYRSCHKISVYCLIRFSSLSMLCWPYSVGHRHRNTSGLHTTPFLPNNGLCPCGGTSCPSQPFAFHLAASFYSMKTSTFYSTVTISMTSLILGQMPFEVIF